MQLSSRPLLSTLAKGNPIQPAAATSAKLHDAEPVALVLPQSAASLKRPLFLSNARIDITSLAPSIVQLPEVRIVSVVDTGDAQQQTEENAQQKRTTTQTAMKAVELPWQASPEPITDVGALANKYLMLSKFRLTCEFQHVLFCKKLHLQYLRIRTQLWSS